jgi:hypothetical protein
MALVDVKENAKTKRFMLARIRVRRYVSRQAVSIGGSDYSLTAPGFVAGMTINSTALTQVTSLSGNNQYTFNESTNAITVRLASAPNGTTQILCLDYFIFLTSGEALYWHSNPDSTSTSRVEWLPRLQTPPTVNQSISSVLDGGVFTFSAGSFDAANADSYFDTFLSADDSYRDAPVDIWICYDEVGNRRKIFNGACQSIAVNDSVITFSLYDAFSPLSKPAFMGDTAEESYFLKQTGSFPNVFPGHQDRIVPLFYGVSTRHRIKPGLINLFQFLDESAMPEASCTTYTAAYSNSNNREWGLCRLSQGGVLTAFIDTTNAVSLSYQAQSGGHYYTLQIPIADFDPFYCQVGFTFKITEAAKPTNYYRVVRIDETGSNKRIRLWEPNVGTNPAYSTSATFSTFPGVALNLVRDGVSYALMYERDYTIAGSGTTGGNVYYEANLVSNFESTFGLGSIKPGEDKLYYMMYGNFTDGPPGTFCQKLIESSGISCDSTPFSLVDSGVNAFVNFGIPDYDEQDYPTYSEVLAKVLRSILGYVRLNTSGQAQAYLFSAPSPGDVYTDSDILNLSTGFEYRDLATKVIAYNPSSSEYLNEALESSLTDDSTRAQFLNRASIDTRLRHVLTDISDRLEEIVRLRSRPYVTYTFQVASKAVEQSVGDDIELQSAQVAGGTVDLKIIGLEFSTDAITVTGTPLEGLSATDV